MVVYSIQLVYSIQRKILRNSIRNDSVIEIRLFKKKKHVHVASLQDLDSNKVVSKVMIEKIAYIGLCLEHLKVDVTRSGLTD